MFKSVHRNSIYTVFQLGSIWFHSIKNCNIWWVWNWINFFHFSNSFQVETFRVVIGGIFISRIKNSDESSCFIDDVIDDSNLIFSKKKKWIGRIAEKSCACLSLDHFPCEKRQRCLVAFRTSLRTVHTRIESSLFPCSRRPHTRSADDLRTIDASADQIVSVRIEMNNWLFSRVYFPIRTFQQLQQMI